MTSKQKRVLEYRILDKWSRSKAPPESLVWLCRSRRSRARTRPCTDTRIPKIRSLWSVQCIFVRDCKIASTEYWPLFPIGPSLYVSGWIRNELARIGGSIRAFGVNRKSQPLPRLLPCSDIPLLFRTRFRSRRVRFRQSRCR